MNYNKNSFKNNSTQGYGKLTSRREKPLGRVVGQEDSKILEKLTDIVKAVENDTFEFTTVVNGRPGPVVRLERLYDLKRQDVIKWTSRFRLIMRQCDYNETQAVDMLKLATNDNLHELLASKKTLEGCLAAIIKADFGKEKFDSLM